MEKDLENLLLQAKSEITQLRRTNEIFGARLDGFDMAMQLLYATPPNKGGVGMSEDIAWKIDQYINAKKGT